MEKQETFWIVSAHSESGDSYPPKKYSHPPTKKELERYIIEETNEQIYCYGPGDFDSYVYLEINKV